MKKSKLLIATLILGIVVSWLSLFFTGNVYADDSDYASSSITVSGLNKTESSKLCKFLKDLNKDLGEHGYFQAPSLDKRGNPILDGRGRTQLKTQEFLSTKTETDNSKKKQNNTSVSGDIYDVTVTARWDLYNGYDVDQKQGIYQIILSNLQATPQLSQGTRVKLYNYFVDSDTTTSNLVRQLSTDVSADFAGGYSLFKPFAGPIGVVFGLIAILVFMGLTLSMLIDISFIVIPAFQLLDDGKQPPHVLFLKVSTEAWNAVHDAEKDNNGVRKQAMYLYLQTRIKQLAVIGLCILYLVSGKIYTLLAMFIDSFMGFLPQ